MGTKSNKNKAQDANAAPRAGQAAPQAQPANPSPVEEQDQTAPPMKKGIYLSALVYVEGMQAPADDFAALAKVALDEALSGEHKGLTITLKKSHVENNVDDQDDSGHGQSGGFEF